MPTGLQAEQGYSQLNPTQAAEAEARRLAERQRLLPGLMREAAQRGSYQLVGDLRLEWDALPARLWAARYTALHSELAAYDPTVRGQRDRHGLLMDVTKLANELGDPA
jgi:hypothetical protein